MRKPLLLSTIPMMPQLTVLHLAQSNEGGACHIVVQLVRLQKVGLAGRFALRGWLATVFERNGWSFPAWGGFLRTASIRWERFGGRWADAVVHGVSERRRLLSEAKGIRPRRPTLRSGVDLSLLADA